MRTSGVSLEERVKTRNYHTYLLLNCGLLWVQVWNMEFHKLHVIFCLIGQILNVNICIHLHKLIAA